MAEIKPTPSQLEWLRQAVASRVPYHVMAAHIGCHEDTIKRLLNRTGLHAIAGEKYEVSRSRQHRRPSTWTRPCICCGARTRRPRLQYRCDHCLERQSLRSDLAGLPDTWLAA